MASMHAVLVRTMNERTQELAATEQKPLAMHCAFPNHDSNDSTAVQMRHVRETRASEVRVVHGADDLRYPDLDRAAGVAFHAKEVSI